MKKSKKETSSCSKKLRPDILYICQRMDKLEENIYKTLAEKDKLTDNVATALDKRLDAIELEIVGVKKAVNIFMWFAKIVGSIASLIALLWKVFQWCGPKVAK
jgi:hypothetical protein